VVVARYLGRQDEIQRVAQIFRGWLGETASYNGFQFGALDWQADPSHPVGINPRGAVHAGHSVDGVLPDDQRRSGPFTWPPPKENYVYEALQGALLQAMVLERAGYDVWSWGDKALLRAFQWLEHQADFPAEGGRHLGAPRHRPFLRRRSAPQVRRGPERAWAGPIGR
jgi:hypothetical protein